MGEEKIFMVVYENDYRTTIFRYSSMWEALNKYCDLRKDDKDGGVETEISICLTLNESSAIKNEGF